LSSTPSYFDENEVEGWADEDFDENERMADEMDIVMALVHCSEEGTETPD
jgi:hypothetical protein